MILLVTGGRDDDRARVFAELDAIEGFPAFHVRYFVVGDCETGADLFAREWLLHRGTAGMVEWKCRRAFWSTLGKRAGPARNAAMVSDVRAWQAQRPDLDALCLAFPGGNGTADCVRRARAAGIPVRIVESDK